jgi:hypothetical protein
MAPHSIDLCPSCEIRQRRRQARETIVGPEDLDLGYGLWDLVKKGRYTLADLKELWHMFYSLTCDPNSPLFHSAALLHCRRIIAELALPFFDFHPNHPLVNEPETDIALIGDAED